MACAADLPPHTEIAWIHEANEPGVLLIEERIGLLGIRRGIPAVRPFPRFRETGLDMRLARGLLIHRRAALHPLRHDDLRRAAMTIGAAQADHFREVHGRRIRLPVATDTAHALPLRFFLRLHHDADAGRSGAEERGLCRLPRADGCAVHAPLESGPPGLRRLSWRLAGDRRAAGDGARHAGV